MEFWRTEVIEGKRPEVLSGRTFSLALALHVVAFLGFGLFAALHGLFDKKETIIPIDLTVIVNENLEGKENEPPPLKNPTPPEPPKPKPKPKPKPVAKKPEPPKALEQIVTNIVEKVEKKPEKKREPEKTEPKKDEPKKEPEPPKKTAKELREEKLKRIRDKMKVVNKKVTIEIKDAKQSGDGRTARQTMTRAQIEALLRQGYRPGTENQLATNEKQRCLSLIQMAIEEKWSALSPKVGRDGTVCLSVQFNSSGGLVNVRLSSGCGDALSDQAALQVARAVTSIRGLSAEFIAEYRKSPLTIRYRVRGR